MVGEGCLLTSVPTLELQAWTGRGLQRAPPSPAQRAVGGPRAVGGSILSSGEIGWLVARGFILSKGQIPPGMGAVHEGLGFGEAPLLPQWKGALAESQHPPGWLSGAEIGLRGRRCGHS